MEAGRRERRVLARVTRAAWRLEQAEAERRWALCSARAEGLSIVGIEVVLHQRQVPHERWVLRGRVPPGEEHESR